MATLDEESPSDELVVELITSPCNGQCLFLNLSISDYRFSVSVIERDAKSTGDHVFLTCCSKTAPRPCDDASADTFVAAVKQ